MKILIIQRQISPRKQVFWNDKAKINAASLSPSLHACVEKKREEGVERISARGCMPLCLHPMCVGASASVCVLAGWTAASCPAACAVTQRIPLEAGVLFQPATSRLGQRRGDTTRREVQISQGLEEKKKYRHTCTWTCKHRTGVTKALTVRQTGGSCFWTSMHWVKQHTAWANYHLSVKLYEAERVPTKCMHTHVCVSEFSCQDVRHTTVSQLGVVFF